MEMGICKFIGSSSIEPRLVKINWAMALDQHLAINKGLTSILPHPAQQWDFDLLYVRIDADRNGRKMSPFFKIGQKQEN